MKLWNFVERNGLERELFKICDELDESAIPAVTLLGCGESKAGQSKLVELCQNKVKCEYALISLLWRHVRAPSDVLAEQVERNAVVLGQSRFARAIVFTLLAYPTGAWDKALYSLSRKFVGHDESPWKALSLRRSEISGPVRAEILRDCRLALTKEKAPENLVWVVKFSAWFGEDVDLLKAKLANYLNKEKKQEDKNQHHR
jgi:hypothetical protein